MRKRNLLAALLSGVMLLSGTPAITEAFSTAAYAASEKLAAPSDFSVESKTESSVKLTWSKVSGANAYRVFIYDSDANEYKTYKSVTGTSCNVTGLSSGTVYRFKVAALIKSGSSYKVQTISSKISVKTDKDELLEAPQNIKATAAETSIKLSWDKMDLADAYRVYKLNNSTNKYEVYKNVGGTSCTVKNLSSGTKYKFKIVALVKSGSKYKEQTYSGAVSVSTKGSAMRTTPGDFETPDFGSKSSTVLKNCGIANYKLISTSASKKQYAGDVLFAGYKSRLVLSFNSKDQLYGYSLSIPMSYSDYTTILSVCKESWGYDYSLDYSSGYDIEYKWYFGNSGILVSYDSDYKTTEIIAVTTAY